MTLMLHELPASEAIAFAETIVVPAPVTLRANTARVSRDALATALHAERPDASLVPSPVAPDGLEARQLDAPSATRAFQGGLYVIQDAGAQVVAELCGAAQGERILDACAGNGGKTAHLLALAGGPVRVDALDVSADKLDEGRRVSARLGLEGATFLPANLTETAP